MMKKNVNVVIHKLYFRDMDGPIEKFQKALEEIREKYAESHTNLTAEYSGDYSECYDYPEYSDGYCGDSCLKIYGERLETDKEYTSRLKAEKLQKKFDDEKKKILEIKQKKIELKERKTYEELKKKFDGV